jgi:methyl-accepting chemotaxis protein
VWADGKTRSTGVKLKDTALTDKVLKQGETYEGNVSLQNRSLLTVFVPLKDVDGAVQGMLMASQPETAILRTAGRSIELTFLMTSLMLVISILPIYLVARSIVRQLD